MTILIDLFLRATRRAGRAERLERACEQIEATAGRLFSVPTIGRAVGSYGAAATVIQSLLALGLIDRIGPPRARQVWYVVPRQHMPAASTPIRAAARHEAGPGSATGRHPHTYVGGASTGKSGPTPR